MKSVIFARVSSREQEDTGYSLDAQIKLLQDYADKKELKVAKTFRVSESASGKQVRKEFNEMLNYVSKNNFPIILCEKIDRLTRNPKDAGVVDEWVKENDKREVHFVKESFILNKNTKAHESFVWNMKVAMARFYTDNLSEEVKKGMGEKLKQGWLPTKPPLGYKTVGDKGHKIHIIDKEKAPFIRKMFELYAMENYSTKTLVDRMYKDGLRTRDGNKLVKSRLHELLSDPFYYGKIRWKGVVYAGKHDPLISKDLFDVVHNKLTRKTNAQYKKHLPVFKAKIKCEDCRGTITWEIQKNKWYGHCGHYRNINCTQKTYVRQERVEEQLFPFFDGVAPKNERVIRWIEKALRESHADEVGYNETKREGLNRVVRIADRRIEEAYKDKLDGKMPAELCESIIKKSAEEKELTLDSLKKLNESRKAYYEAGIAIHKLAFNAKNIYQSPKATAEKRRLLLNHVFSNMTLDKDKVTPSYTLAFEFLAEWVPKLNKIFEPPETPINKAETGLADPVSA